MEPNAIASRKPVLSFSNFVFANSAKIGHGKFASNYDVDGERWMERWWFV